MRECASTRVHFLFKCACVCLCVCVCVFVCVCVCVCVRVCVLHMRVMCVYFFFRYDRLYANFTGSRAAARNSDDKSTTVGSRTAQV